ncbi:DNA-directed RNA polymerase III complex subunit Rpc37, partial [Coniochaeta ligniaria NRRL 30616]
MSATSTPTLQEEDDDPIEHTYSVFIKPPLPPTRRLVILQHPNNQSDNPHGLESPPIAGMRLKSASGMLEADVPIDYNAGYDRHKGMVWGGALQKSAAAKTSLGLAGGFGVGGAPARTRGRQAAAGEDNVEGGDWGEAVRNDRIVRMQTLGGLSTEPKDARYLVAVFQGKNVHLTPVTSLAHLRPQLHHIDASAEQDRITRATAGAGGGASQKDAPAARAIHMTIKSMADGNEAAEETMADRLRGVQVEPWKKMDFADEESPDSWITYQENLLLHTDEGGDEKGADTKGKGPDVKAGEETEAEDGKEGNAGAPDLDERVYGLGTDWGEDELLRAVSGIKADDKKPGEEAVTDRVDAKARGKGKAPVKKELGVKPEPGAEADGAKKVGRPRKPAAA